LPFLDDPWIPNPGHSGTPPFYNPIIHLEFFPRFDVPCREIGAVNPFPWINSNVGRIAMIYESIIVAAKNKSVMPRIDVTIVKHGFTEVSGLQFEFTRIEV
jgi:hypothetical protein